MRLLLFALTSDSDYADGPKRTIESPLIKVIELTQTSYTVLGLISMAGEPTPYDLKQLVAISVGNFWSIPHSQLYAEPDRLADAGYLTVRRESGGRRRKHYKLTSRCGRWRTRVPIPVRASPWKPASATSASTCASGRSWWTETSY
jgi:DNA-binding PadR family transcriptional regulator